MDGYMTLLLQILISAIAILLTTYILPGVTVAGFGTAILVVVVLAVINAFLWPILLVLTLPINILTLGLFTFVIMGFLVMLASYIVPGFEVASFWWALGFSIVLAIINAIFGGLGTL